MKPLLVTKIGGDSGDGVSWRSPGGGPKRAGPWPDARCFLHHEFRLFKACEIDSPSCDKDRRGWLFIDIYINRVLL